MLISWRKELFRHVWSINMLIDVGCTPFISCATFLQKMECDRVRLIIEDWFGHGGVSQQRLVVTIHLCGILYQDYHRYEIIKKAIDTLAGLIHCNQLTTVRTGIIMFLILRSSIYWRIVEENHQSWSWMTSYTVSSMITVDVYLNGNKFTIKLGHVRW